ncbi:hypothetical protein TrST_g1569 [Triparma strigata]|uniref:Uncharacterized protein n=1 Tax=Triparma strigata TaxID=1606541 RepID=A0A9W7BQV4_9STRA|nr:hypothetical protein TrST_g1569 [Triparma strigata]
MKFTAIASAFLSFACANAQSDTIGDANEYARTLEKEEVMFNHNKIRYRHGAYYDPCFHPKWGHELPPHRLPHRPNPHHGYYDDDDETTTTTATTATTTTSGKGKGKSGSSSSAPPAPPSPSSPSASSDDFNYDYYFKYCIDLNGHYMRRHPKYVFVPRIGYNEYGQYAFHGHRTLRGSDENAVE